MSGGYKQRRKKVKETTWHVLQSLTEEALPQYIANNEDLGGAGRQSRTPNGSTPPNCSDGLEDMGLRNGQGHDCPAVGVRDLYMWWNQLLPTQLLC